MLNIKRTLIIVVYAIVRLYAPLLPQLTHFLLCCCYPFRTRETSFSTVHNRNPPTSRHPMPNRLPTSTPLTVLVSELFRIIIFVSERHPRGSKLKLSFLAFTRMKERERGKEWRTERDERIRRRREIVQQERLERFLSRLLRATSRLRFSVAAS